MLLYCSCIAADCCTAPAMLLTAVLVLSCRSAAAASLLPCYIPAATLLLQYCGIVVVDVALLLLLLHCSFIVAPSMPLSCCFESVALLLPRFCCAVAALLLTYCYLAAALLHSSYMLLNCSCSAAASLLLPCCISAAAALQQYCCCLTELQS